MTKEELLLEFFAEYECNGFNATAAGAKLGIPKSTAKRWAAKRAKQENDRASGVRPGLKRYGHVVFKHSGKGYRRHLVIPDVQAKPGDDFTFLTKIGEYIVDKKPPVLVCGGDFSDMPSLSSYDKGKKSFEGRRYKKDVLATHEAMEALLRPIREYNLKQIELGLPIYQPEMYLFEGNHEHRISRAIENQPELEGVIGLEDLKYEEYGWKVFRFLEVAVIDGIAYSHYMTTGTMGRPATSPQVLMNKKHMSCVVFHQQGLQIVTGFRIDGKQITCIICGSCYEHNEDYLGPQGNNYFRGILVLHDVRDGEFDTMPVSLKYLRNRKRDTQ